MRGSWHAETLSSHNCQFSIIYEQIIFVSDPVFSKLPKIDTLKQWKKQFPSPGTSKMLYDIFDTTSF